MAGLGPAIHALAGAEGKAWMAAPSAAMTWSLQIADSERGASPLLAKWAVKIRSS
jgi:hypothetical protein